MFGEMEKIAEPRQTDIKNTPFICESQFEKSVGKSMIKLSNFHIEAIK